MRTGFRTGYLLAGLVACAAAPGCDNPSKVVAVRGTVRFEGQPVGEGFVQFNDAATGNGAEVRLQSDGSYTADLPAGTYTVVVLPALVDALMRNKDTPPDVVFKKVRNIPVKYHSTVTSGLTAEVSADKTVHDFDLRP